MRIRATLFCSVLFFIPLQLCAQESQPRWFLGVIGGYNADFHSGNIPDECSCRTQESTGTGNGIIFGFAVEQWFNDDGVTSLQMKAYFEAKPGSFSFLSNQISVYDTSTGQIKTYQLYRNVAVKYNLFNFEILFKYNTPFLSHLGVSVGPKFGIVTSTNYNEYETMPSPYLFQNGTPTQTFADEPIPGNNSIHIGAKLSVQYEVLLSPLLITPAVSYDYGITKIVDSWQVNTFAGTIDVKYGL